MKGSLKQMEDSRLELRLGALESAAKRAATYSDAGEGTLFSAVHSRRRGLRRPQIGLQIGLPAFIPRRQAGGKSFSLGSLSGNLKDVGWTWIML